MNWLLEALQSWPRKGRGVLQESERSLYWHNAAGGTALTRNPRHGPPDELDVGVSTVKLAEPIDIRGLLRTSPLFGTDEVLTLCEAISGSQITEVRQEVNTLIEESGGRGSLSYRAGIALQLLGRHTEAHELLNGVTDDGVAVFYDACALVSLGDNVAAGERYLQAAAAGYDEVECSLRRVGTIRADGHLDEAEAALKAAPSGSTARAEYSYQMGCILADQCNTPAAVESFERAIDMDPHHSRALFNLALENARHGNDDEAIRLYEQSLSRPPQFLGALLNLGLLYEDSENYSAAEFCFRRVLATDPNHSRARLYLKDIEATADMYYDEDQAKEETRMQQLLSRPVTDFELTVRSRNCLEGIGITSLGDLTQVTEMELLSGKNFGETSLVEIRELLTMHGLSIGENINKEQELEPTFAPTDMSPEERAIVEKPVADLNLSVRARKCMARLGITQLGELLRRTPDELLSSKNFGVTSLNEIRAKLDELELKLRND